MLSNENFTDEVLVNLGEIFLNNKLIRLKADF